MNQVKTTNSKHLLQPKNWSQSSQHERFNIIKPYIQGKSVLDLGCAVGHHRNDWMHGLINEVAASVTGVDLDREAVELLQKRGYNIVWGDAQAIRVNKEFDVVFAGELIEHLDNFAGFISTAKTHLSRDGVFVLTTPNAFCFTNFLYRFGGTPRVNKDHTCWFCEDTIQQLLQRHGFVVTNIQYISHQTPGLVRRIISNIFRLFLPNKLAWNTLLVVTKPID